MEPHLTTIQSGKIPLQLSNMVNTSHQFSDFCPSRRGLITQTMVPLKTGGQWPDQYK